MPSNFIEPCLPSPADCPPSGTNWIHEIKHDGYRLMARRDPVGIRLITRRGNDWTTHFPLIVEAVNHLVNLQDELSHPSAKAVELFQRALETRSVVRKSARRAVNARVADLLVAS